MSEPQRLPVRSQTLRRNDEGYNQWEITHEMRRLIPTETAIIICDMWDRHWSKGASARVDEMAVRMNEVVKTARNGGVQIIHSPSDTVDFYAGTPARNRVQNATQRQPPPLADHADYPLPIDDSDGGSDTGEQEEISVWSRQHAAIEIDQTHDGISDNGQEIYNFLTQKRINNVLIMGVHTNMCILNRSFGIKQMVRWGFDVLLVRDLTDALYNPAKPPYVSHAEGTELVIGYIEKFWCPSVLSHDLVVARS